MFDVTHGKNGDRIAAGGPARVPFEGMVVDRGFDAACHDAAVLGAEQAVYESLPSGHILRTFIDQHRQLLMLLDQLESITVRLQTSTGDRGHVLVSMAAITSRVRNLEFHHDREEEVLFHELKARGIIGPTLVMAGEHSDIHRLLDEVLELVEAMLEGGSDHRIQLVRAARETIVLMRNHMGKENNVVYPMALGILRDDLLWERMKSTCLAIREAAEREACEHEAP